MEKAALDIIGIDVYKRQVLRMEATLDPVHNVFVTLQIERARLIYGIGGLLGGTLLFLVIRLFCRRTG